MPLNSRGKLSATRPQMPKRLPMRRPYAATRRILVGLSGLLLAGTDCRHARKRSDVLGRAREARSLVPLGEARLGRIGFEEWLRHSKAAA
jgi:hypothetical protein